jgi:hypothetical protein
MGEIKHMPIAEFRALGWVQEINRRLLHPAGLALEVTVDDDGSERLSGVWDLRDDPEGIYFGDLSKDDVERAKALDADVEDRSRSRKKALGYIIQPLEPMQ